MTFHGETCSRPSLSDRLVALLRSYAPGRAANHAQRIAAGESAFCSRAEPPASTREHHHDGDPRTRRERGAHGPLLWTLVSFHLGLSALLTALYDTWWALLILVWHVLLCASWAFALRSRSLAMASLERRACGAEESARSKSALFASISHEMRAPLNGILGMSSLLSRTPLDARQSEQVETLRRCADNLLVMVNDVLDFARLEAGKLPIEAAPFEPRAAVDEVLAMNGPRAQEKHLELFAVVERSVPQTVVGDMTRVRQALTNLVANAIKFTAAGEVEVRISVPHAGRLRFSVSDTGIGIEPSARPRLFAPFSQADGSISKRYGGSGLGLAISRRLVLAMGGDIDFESTPGVGSRFFFELPFAGFSAGGALSSSLARPSARFDEPSTTARVVLVVPHGGTREGLLEVCAWLGCGALCADDLSVLQGPFDAAIIDGALPLAELQALSSHPNRERILIISRAGAEMPSWPRLSLSWPVRQSGLCGALRALLGSRAEPPEPNQERFAAQTRVLVVEDTPVNQIVAEALLSELGVSVQIARDGEEALQLLETERFELVLMDCQLPTLSGFETTRRLRASFGPNHKTPVVALTGSTLEGDEATCREAGMDDYLTKPIRRLQLIDTLKRWLPSTYLQSHPERASIPSNDVSLEGAAREPSHRASNDLVELEEFMLGFAHQVGSSAVGRLATTYRESVPDTASCLARALRDGGGAPDRVALAKYAHALQGATRSMGLRALSQRLEELERASSSADMTCLRTLTSDVEARIRLVCETLATHETSEAWAAAQNPNREAVG